ncbi:FMN-binding protein [Dubosiella muris]|uniref:FMN-binding protein n=1 Tax=Dubosiella muris TaxID=3038133 RepID=A0AC61R7N8_9FIRM|nr:FMN-binding protein [Dubosiella muris]TGY65583.1 FMN-binding protein [Dubosiella muris]
MKQILHLTLFLAIVSALAGGALAFANQMTAPVIQANNERAEKQVLLEMYPDANVDEFEIMDVTTDNPSINKIYSFENNYIFNMSVSGYKDGTTFLVAIDKNDLKVTAFKAISNGDTKGIGSKIMESAFAEGVVGKEAAGPIDTISGATVTSTPVVDGIHQAADIAAGLE